MGITRVAAPAGKPALRRTLRSSGFGTPEQNKLVERAAVRYVMRHYESKGWSAHDVSSKNHGYDLKCENYRQEHHVEVKGARGEGQRFALNARELKTWTNDKQFVGT